MVVEVWWRSGRVGCLVVNYPEEHIKSSILNRNVHSKMWGGGGRVWKMKGVLKLKARMGH